MRRAFVLAAAAFLLLLSAPASPAAVNGHGGLALAVDAQPPAWLAPGAKLQVAGRARPRAPVVLEDGARALAAARADESGRWVLAIRLERVGRYRLTLRSGRTRLHLRPLSVRPVLLAAVGDVTFARNVAAEISLHGPGYPWLEVADLLSQADIATANLECVLSRRGDPVHDKPPPSLRADPDVLRPAVRRAGPDVFTVANNHTLDYGPEAFADTLTTIRKLGAAAVGGGRNLTRARRPVVLRRGGLRIAFLAYDDTWAPYHAGPAVPGTAPADPSLVEADVQAAAAAADLVVVWFHWGELFTSEPNTRQADLAQAALDGGAAVVLGAHPHVLQAVEQRDRTLVAYSLGNFVFYWRGEAAARSGILQLSLDRGGLVGADLVRVTIVDSQPRLDRVDRAHAPMAAAP